MQFHRHCLRYAGHKNKIWEDEIVDKGSNKIKISIIIPVYNVEDYLDQCLSSICGQYEEGMQIICIDDCSTDKSSEILLEWEKKCSGIEVYHNNKNSGLAYTRNVGISHAQGEYLMFVDSDDYVAENVIGFLYKKAKENHSDILIFSVKMFADADYNESFNMDLRIRKSEYDCLKGFYVISEMIQGGEMFGAVWTALYRLEYVKDKNIRFINGIIHEDVPFFFKSMLEADRVCGVVDIGYYYRQRKSSILHKVNNFKLLEGLFVGYTDMINNWFLFNQMRNIEMSVVENINKYLDNMLMLIKRRYFYSRLLGEDINPAVSNFFYNVLKGKGEKDSFPATTFNNMKIAVYGAGKHAKDAIAFLKKDGVLIEKIYVTDKTDNPDKIMDIEVCEFSKDNIMKDLLIVIAVKNSDDIVRLLKINGINHYVEYRKSVINYREFIYYCEDI